MEVLRVHLRGWTASFRYPGFAVGLHPTLPLPPLSTLYGLISAAKGEAVTPHDCALGFVFQSSGEATDMETTYEIDSGLSHKQNITLRQLLFEPELWLYLADVSMGDSFRRPYHPLILGRSTELVEVISVEPVSLLRKTGGRLGKTLLPYPQTRIAGVLQALPTHFTPDIPRQAVGVRPWLLVQDWQTYPDELLYDEDLEWGVWMHSPLS